MGTWTEKDAMEAAHCNLPFTLGISDDGRYAIRAIKGSYETMSLIDHLCDCVNWNPDHPHEIYRKALALHGQPVPAPKREPTLLEAAKEWLKWRNSFADAKLCAAIQREEAKIARTPIAKCDECPAVYYKRSEINTPCDVQYCRGKVIALEAKPATDEKLRAAVRYYCTRGADGGNGYAALYAAAKDAGIIT